MQQTETIRHRGREFIKTDALSVLINRAPGTLANDRYHSRGIPYVKLPGGGVSYDLEDVFDYMDSHKINPSDH